MQHILDNGEESVRRMLVTISKRNSLKEIDTIEEEDFMDDGSLIRLALTIDRKARTALFNFAGTSPQVLGNINTPKSVTLSAIIYCLRCLVKGEIPLNSGCLRPIEIKLPESCLLNPADDAAIVAGNVLTSQRVTDVILKAFRACAAS